MAYANPGQTWLIYNDIQIQNCQTLNFEQSVRYDKSGTDKIYDEFKIKVVGYAHSIVIQSGGLEPNPPHSMNITTVQDESFSSAGQQELAIRARLTTPRAALIFKVGADRFGAGGVDLLTVNPQGKTNTTVSLKPESQPTINYDVNNGPKPQSINVTQITGNTLFRIEFEVTCCVVACSTTGDAPKQKFGVLSNRWSCRDMIDQDFFTTRTITGELITANGSISPHEFRDWVIPRLRPGFKRQDMEFTASEDGRVLQYTFTDKEIAYSAPRPATSWKMTHKESAYDGGLVRSTVNIEFSGPRNVNRTQLFAIAAHVFDAKMIMSFVNDKHKRYIEELTFTDEYGDGVNRVLASISVLRSGDQKDIFGTVSDQLGNPPSDQNDIFGPNVQVPYDSNLSRGASQFDQIDLSGPIDITGAWAAYLQTPCDDNHGICAAAENNLPRVGPCDPRLGGTVPLRIRTVLPPAPFWTSPSHDASIYTHYHVESRLQHDHDRMQLPIAGWIGTSLGGGSIGGGTAVQATSSVFTMGLGALRRIVRVVGQRIGSPPAIPKPLESYLYLATGGTATLLKSLINYVSPTREPGGGQVHEVHAEYQYAIDAPPDQSSTSIPIGFNPWEEIINNTHSTIPQVQFHDSNP